MKTTTGNASATNTIITDETTTDTTRVMPRFWTDNFKTHDSEMCNCDTCKRYRKQEINKR